jgi:thymidylate synthase (FAD)
MRREGRDIIDFQEDELVRELDAEIVEGTQRYDLFVSERDQFRPKFWIKTRPRVYLVGGNVSLPGLQEFYDDNGLGEFDAGAPNSKEELVQVAGRLCYWSFPNPRPGGHEAYIKHILESGHGSVIEHAVFNFIITGVSRSFTHELVRHRIASYSQLSQRFFSEEECAFVMPPKVAMNRRLRSAWLMAVEAAYDGYLALMETLPDEYTDIVSDVPREQKTLRIKAARGEARSVLPSATETKVFMSINARSLRHLIEMRASREADQEIRRVARAMFDLVSADSPTLFADYQEQTAPGLGRFVVTPWRKV